MKHLIAREVILALEEVSEALEEALREAAPAKTKRRPAKKKATTRKRKPAKKKTTTRKRTPAKKKPTRRKKEPEAPPAVVEEPPKRRKTKVKKSDLTDVAKAIAKAHRKADLYHSSRGHYTIRFGDPTFELIVRADPDDKLEVVGIAPLKLKKTIKGILSKFNAKTQPEYIPEGRSLW